MRKWILSGLVLSVVSMSSWAEEGSDLKVSIDQAPAAAQAAVLNNISLVTLGEVDPTLVKRIESYLTKNLAIRVQTTAAAAVEGSLAEQLATLSANRSDDSVFVLALTSVETGEETHAIYDHTNRVALINVPVLKPEDGNAESFGRRVEKVAMRSAGILVGLPASPNPQCALYPYKNINELDVIGRNYDPPSAVAFQKKARELGVEFIKPEQMTPAAVKAKAVAVSGEDQGSSSKAEVTTPKEEPAAPAPLQ